MTDTELRSKLVEYEDLLRALTMKCEELASENTRLRSEKSSALMVCQELYSDPNAPAALRLKAAGLALQFEVPRLLPEKAPIDVTATEYEPLSVVVERQRARLDNLLSLPLSEREKLVRGVGNDGNGSDDSSD